MQAKPVAGLKMGGRTRQLMTMTTNYVVLDLALRAAEGS